MSDQSYLHYVVAEYQILHEMFHDPALTQLYQRDIFSHPEAEALYDSIRILYETTGAVSDTDVLREANKLCDRVTSDTIQLMLNTTKPVVSMDDLVKEARESAVLLKVKSRFTHLVTQILEKKIDSVTLSSELYQLQRQTLNFNTGRIKFDPIAKWMDDFREDLEVRRIGAYQTFNDTFLDTNLTRKAEPGQIILIAGATGNGKSAFALNMINGMINCELPVMYFTLEMDRISTLDRLMAVRTEIPVKDWYVQGDAIDALIQRVDEEQKAMEGKPFQFFDNAVLSLAEIEAAIRKFKTIHGIQRCVVFIDLVTQVKEFVQVDKSRNMATAIELACNRMNEIAKDENVCIVALAQVGRNADSIKLAKKDDLEKLRPTLNDIKNSNALAERSRVVISVFRAKYYADRYLSHLEDVEYMEDFIDIQILKQSQGNISKPHQYLYKAECMKIMPVVSVESEGVEF